MKILFIDDDPMMLRMAGFILKKAGAEALTAPSGEEGVRLADDAGDSLDMVFIDIEMPKLGGFDTLKLIRQRFDGCVYMVSGTVNEEIRNKALQLGAQGVIEKPLNANEIFGLIK